ncbi:hypothetical protein GCM10025857_13500 [Alicyclobacillus contaminans]|nr:hypothetical protein GCM10025857_13500 [Alicyclobacillus contaminans]
MAASTTPEPLNSFGVRFLVEQTARRARLLDSEQLSVLKAYLSVSKSPVMALIDVRDGRLRVAGAALFREGTMVGTLTPNEMEALSLLRSGRGEISVSIPCPTSAADTNTSLQIDSWRRNMRSSFVGQRLHLEIQLTVSGEIERLCPGGQLNKQVLRSVQREGEAIIQRRLRTVIEKLQSDGSDAGDLANGCFRIILAGGASMGPIGAIFSNMRMYRVQFSYRFVVLDCPAMRRR